MKSCVALAKIDASCDEEDIGLSLFNLSKLRSTKLAGSEKSDIGTGP